MRRMFSFRWQIAALIVLSCLTPSAPAIAQGFVASYEPSNTFESGMVLGYDHRAEQYVLANIRNPNPFFTDLAVELVFRPSSPTPSRYTYSADFLNLESADFELVDLLTDHFGYVVFINKLDTQTDHWSSWVIRIERDHSVVWARQLTLASTKTLRVRQAVSLKNGSAVLASLDNELINGNTTLAVLDFDGDVTWAKSYYFDESIDLIGLHGGVEGLVAGGFFSDLKSSENLGDLVLLKVAPLDGETITAMHYADVWPDPFRRLPMASSAGVPSTSGGLHVVAKTAGSSLIYLPIYSSLQAGFATTVDLDASRTAVDLAFLPQGGLLTILTPSSGFGEASEVLQLTALSPFATGNPTVWQVDGVVGFDAVDLMHAAQGSDHVVLAGAAEAAGATAFQHPMVVAETNNDGSLDYCVPQRLQDAQGWAVVDDNPIGAIGWPVGLESQPIIATLDAIGSVQELHQCH